MNFFDAVLEAEDERCFVNTAGVRFELPPVKAERVLAGIKGAAEQDGKTLDSGFSAVLGIRSEDLYICGSEDSDAITGTAEMSEMMGSSLYIHLSCFGRDVVVISRAKDEEGRLVTDCKAGSSVSFRLDPSAVHLFDPETGLNLENMRQQP
jgi:multiple sugar transport system ATP-binding protein